jgi:uncharacterized membrane protein YozB (DUF420 family)
VIRKYFISWLAGCAVIWASDRPIHTELIAAAFTAATVFFALKYLTPPTQHKDNS